MNTILILELRKYILKNLVVFRILVIMIIIEN